MNRRLLWLGKIALVAIALVPASFAQLNLFISSEMAPDNIVRDVRSSSLPDVPLVSPVVLPRMSPELALLTYERRAQEQSARLLAYSDQTFMRADLPDTRQSGEYELKRQYAAPNTLQFTPVRFTGDGFVKSNVLIRLLQSEVDHVAKQQGPNMAIDDANYKFSHKSMEVVDGKTVYVYQVKPRKKRVGLFKGKIYLDAYTGALLRAEGQMVKSPSLFIKKIDFVQDYKEVDGFTLPFHLHSVAKVRIIGRAIVDIFHRDYQPKANGALAETSATPAAAPQNPASPSVGGASGRGSE